MSTSNTRPKYIQISELLIREIMAGRLKPGDRLSPERSMAAEMGTSVGTIRKALGDLQQKGILERRQGSGNYIRAGGDLSAVYSFFRIELKAGGGLPTARTLSVDLMTKPFDAPEFGASKMAYRIRRIRALNNTPAVIEEVWLDGNCAPELHADKLGNSLYLYYRNELNFWITKVEDKITTGQIPDWYQGLFGMPPLAPCVCVQRVSYSQQGTAVEYSRNWIDSTVANYVTRIG